MKQIFRLQLAAILLLTISLTSCYTEVDMHPNSGVNLHPMSNPQPVTTPGTGVVHQAAEINKESVQ